MGYYKCKDCEHWYPYWDESKGMCAANYKHDQPATMWTCRNFELREGYTYRVDKDGKQVSEPFKL